MKKVVFCFLFGCKSNLLGNLVFNLVDVKSVTSKTNKRINQTVAKRTVKVFPFYK